MRRAFCVGDIHGHNQALLECLEAVNFDYDKDWLISIGDLVDRGPESFYVVETLLKIKHRTIIQGNHDMWFKQFVLFNKMGEYVNMHPQYYTWAQQGGFDTVNSYLVHGGMNAATGAFKREKEHKQLFLEMKPYFETSGICFVHGGFDSSFPIHKQDEVTLAWDRELFGMATCIPEGHRLKTADGFGLIFLGHTPTMHWDSDEPIYAGGIWNIDTGCGKKGKLTLMNVETQEYYQTKDVY